MIYENHEKVSGQSNVSESRILIDWLSFTIETPEIGNHKAWSIQKFLEQEMTLALGEIWQEIHTATGEWELSSGRPPYSASYRSKLGISLFYNVRIGNILMEISGRGCEWLTSRDLLHPLIRRTSSRITRVDLAVDLMTEVSPKDFVIESASARFKSRGTVVSETGSTEYIGSRKSERYCRVYRYSPPHPRSAFLRVEMVFRKQNAKLFAQSMIDSDFNYTALALGAGKVYAFEHEAWNLTGDEIKLESWTPERAEGKTLWWMTSQVAPAFKRLVKQGFIDSPEDFLRKYFLEP